MNRKKYIKAIDTVIGGIPITIITALLIIFLALKNISVYLSDIMLYSTAVTVSVVIIFILGYFLHIYYPFFKSSKQPNMINGYDISTTGEYPCALPFGRETIIKAYFSRTTFITASICISFMLEGLQIILSESTVISTYCIISSVGILVSMYLYNFSSSVENKGAYAVCRICSQTLLYPAIFCFSSNSFSSFAGRSEGIFLTILSAFTLLLCLEIRSRCIKKAKDCAVNGERNN